MKKKWLLLSGLILCLCLLVGLSVTFWKTWPSDATSIQTETAASSNKTQEMSGLVLTLNGVTTEKQEDDTLLVLADVTIENTRKSTVNFSLMNFTLMDTDHYAYEHVSNVETKGILGGQIPSGRAVSGEVAFIVPKGASFELLYTDHFRTGQLVFPFTVDNK
ncbi:DUF4352 domain-containing protein [Shouchella lonarensis]|uniref:DUF4352 domain-containing protein n=1 Tax=Shouchella lonarensis TaxID=1464122 RepID=A0A1G6HBS4_9BACI|nr:DUF4352 domain-containing protein [Shouchella lonarensis]SDB91720.1 protein of unknown function [Shouchella lonarensis]